MTQKMAYLFPGQGSQFAGMGKEFIESSQSAKARVEEANDILGFDLGRLVMEGPEEELSLTANTQPAILLVSAIAYEALSEITDEKPAIVAGHSLGEFSACLSAGVFSFADAIKIVRKRGELMQSAVPAGEGGMAAVIGLTSEDVARICKENELDVYPANFNSPEQTVIAGSASGVEKMIKIMSDSGAKKCVKLTVSAPFHTRFMTPAREGLSEFIETIKFADPKIPVIRNIDATLASTADEIKEGLISQVTSCVLWVDSMKQLTGLGVDHAIELGPGKVLAGLMKRIDRSVKVISVGTPAGIENALEIANG